MLHRPSLALALLLLTAAAVPAAAQEAQAPSADPQAAPQDGLSQRQREWLEEVAPLITPKEKAAFLALAKDYQREAFIRRFWEVRDPFPQTPQNELRVRWEARAKLARERFGGSLADDRARMMLFNGEPAEVFKVACEVLAPLEIWSFRSTERIRGDFSLVFLRRGTSYRLWYPDDGLGQLLSADLRVPVEDPERGYRAIAELCPRGEDVASRLAEALDWKRVESTLKLVPQVGEEWLSGFSSFSTDVPEGSATFPAQIDLSFPGRFGSRTVVQGLVTVPRDAVKPERIEGSPASTYVFTVDGEVLYKGELFEHFRYRFALPEGEVTSDRIPVVFQRYLRPGAYSLVLKVEDTAGKRYFREERTLEVPAVADPAAAPTAEAAAVAVAGVPPQPPGSTRPVPPQTALLSEANAAIGSDDQTIRILAPPPGLLTGKARIEAVAAGAGIAKVSFELDGRPVLSKTRPPYSVELNLGNQPRVHTLRAAAFDEGGKKVAEDQIQLNVGPHRFALRLVEPEPGKTYQKSLRAQAQVEVPDGDKLDRVEFFVNDNRVATLYQPPFTQPILLPQGRELTYVRAVAFLDDGNSTEDVVLVNAPDYARVDVQFVELFTSVVDGRGHPVTGLTKDDFKVSEDGTPQQVQRFELVKDVPVYAGILLDTSGSMSLNDKLDQAVKGALHFFEKVITPKDRATVVTFGDQPNLAVRFTHDQATLAAGLAGLKAEGNTTLYDSLIFTLYQFGGIKGKKAIVLLSDGRDEGSRYTFNDALDYARRSGVAIYTIGLDLSYQEVDVRSKLTRLADETGGRSYFIQRAGELDRIYDAIQSELRSQYLLAYQSSREAKDPDKFRNVEVKMAKPGLEAKTLRGYYP